MNKFFRIIYLGTLALTSVNAQESNEVPMDPAVRIGQLENGMKYYIRHNEEPKDRASFYFAQNVGSVLETESQRGLAHFLEHMAFNGLEHFEGKAMLEYLEKNGIRFGSEINAFTSFDETVYNVSSVPVHREQLLDSVLLVLKDWSNGLTLKDKDIDEERGVINEEWRSRNTPTLRSYFKIWEEGTLKGSKYAERFPIGLMSVVNNFEYDALRDYYKTWYRPDQQAVVVVGDIDVDQMEQKIKERFSSIPLRKDLPERAEFSVPMPGEFNYVEVVDSELGAPTLQFVLKLPHQDLPDHEQLDENLIGSVTRSIFAKRIKEMLTDVNAPALSVSFSYQNFVRPLDMLVLRVTPKEGQILEAMDFALKEMKRYIQHGATKGEIDRAVASMRTGIKNRDANKHKISNDQHANNLYRHFFNDGPLTSVSWYTEYALNRLEALNNEDIKGWLESHFDLSNAVVSVTGKGEEEYPEKADFEKMIEDFRALETEAYTDTYVDKPLIEDELKGAEITATEQLEALDARIYTLENGVRFVVYHTDHEKNRTRMRAYSPGGMSLLDKELLPAAQLTAAVSGQSGIGSFDINELNKKMQGKLANASLSLGSFSENINGHSQAADLEVMFQQIYLLFESPRFDEVALSLMKERMKKGIKAKEGNKQAMFRDSLQLASNNHHERVFFYDEEMIDNIDLETIKKVYEDRFSDISDFTFFFIGDFDEEKLKEYASLYLGSIKSNGKQETIVDHKMNPAEGKTLVHLQEELKTPQTTVNISLTHEMPFEVRNAVKNSIIAELLKKRYNATIREQEGGSYGVGVGSSVSRIPDERYGVSVSFNCNPEMSEKLVGIVYDEIARIQKQIHMADLEEVKMNMKKSRAEQLNSNSYWMGLLFSHVMYDNEILSQEAYEALIDSISADELQNFASYLSEADIVEGILDPVMDEVAK